VNSFTPLWSGIVDSSIWDEPDHVVKVFCTMLALKDSDHVVRLNAYQLSKRSRKTEVEVLDALRILASPDQRRQEKQEYEGRRIELREDGWLILNGEKYREMMQKENERHRNLRAQAAWRRRQKQLQAQETMRRVRNGAIPGERANERGINNGTINSETGDQI
jgi:hypothetical protein